MATARTRYAVALLPDGRVLIAGGHDGSGKTLASAEQYDPSTGTFTPTDSLAAAREYAVATLLSDGRVLITGGTAGKTSLASAELYTP
jgi:hypothetical protein